MYMDRRIQTDCKPEDYDYAMRVINNLELIYTEEFSKWVTYEENERLLKELLTYRGAMISEVSTRPSVDNELACILKHSKKKKNKPASRIIIYKLTGAAAVILAVFMCLGYLITHRSDNKQDNDKIPEFVYSDKPQNIVLQRDNEEPVIIPSPQQNNTLPQYGGKSKNIITGTPGKEPVRTNGKLHVYTLSIPRGQNYHMTLSDGTNVWLNTESKLRYPESFADSERIVELSGEAYFDVAKDSNRPFIVRSKYLTTKVTGTTFNMKVYNRQDANVTLAEGRVSVSIEGNDKAVTLLPGQNASLENDRFEITNCDVRHYTAWVEGYFYFDNAPLEEIMRELGRWYNINITFTSDQAKYYTFKLWANKNNSIDTTIDQLNLMQKVNIKKERNGVIISEVIK